ncbi:MAG: response regulator [Chloroflexota bacterium]
MPIEFDAFHKQVKDALEHLHDAAYLQVHPLLSQIASEVADSQQTRAQRLRAWLKNAIEQLRPAQDLPSSSPEWRSYLALRYRYLQRMNPTNIENELGISQRQLYRELNKGMDALAALLWEQRGQIAQPPARALDAQDLEGELSQWNLTRQNCDVCALVEETHLTLRPMMQLRGIAIALQMPADLPSVFVDATLTRQALFNVLRFVLNRTRADVVLSAGAQDKHVGIVIVADDVEVDRAAEDWRNAELLFGAQGGILDQNGVGQITIRLPRPTQPRVLVIDDNPAIQQLFERYLAPQQYQVLHAQSGADALRLATEARPDVITLDVMMPNMDGWQVLRALAQDPATAKTPVVVCSVLREPETALALGARAYLKKPVDRLALVETLARVLG